MLEKNGLDLWRDDQEIKPGDQWATAIGRSLQAAPKAIAFVMQRAMKSRWFVSELHAAFIQNKLIWMQLDDIKDHTFPVDISKLLMLNLKEKEEVD